MNFSMQTSAEWASAALVFGCGAAVGHHASLGMNPTQWTGAALAVIGSVAVAVMVRVWPAPVRVEADRD